MIYEKLSGTDIEVSKACLGTMSFGAHVSEETSFKVMDRSLELGINFFDTAELYSVPVSKETYGLTEEIIGRWFKARNSRDKIVLASKVCGPARNDNDNYIREGKTRLDRKNIRLALEASLKRLQTNHIDLYQIHWPDRNVNKFGERNYAPTDESDTIPIEETMKAMQELQKEGKIKHYGLSNETPWGIMEYLRLAKELGLPRPISIQNNYSLLTRSYENSMAEISHRENIGLLAYSPLGYGVLGGRYLNGEKPAGGRFAKYPDFAQRYHTKQVEEIIKKYKALAEENGMTLPGLALAFVYEQFFLTSNIIGPSNVSQLEEDVRALEIKLTPEIKEQIEIIHEECPNVCP
jgi:aryl-alcohol dehydrogenase-like predicted oxidoreductase